LIPKLVRQWKEREKKHMQKKKKGEPGRFQGRSPARLKEKKHFHLEKTRSSGKK